MKILAPLIFQPPSTLLAGVLLPRESDPASGSVNPKAQTYVVNTSNWCDPAKQAEAAKSLFAQGVDVITQHQDCTATITKAAEEAGKMVVGYHADASSLAPKGWITGSRRTQPSLRRLRKLACVGGPVMTTSSTALRERCATEWVKARELKARFNEIFQ